LIIQELYAKANLALFVRSLVLKDKMLLALIFLMALTALFKKVKLLNVESETAPL